MGQSAWKPMRWCLANSVAAVLVFNSGAASGSQLDDQGGSTTRDAGSDCAGDDANSNRIRAGVIAGGCIGKKTVVLTPAAFEKARTEGVWTLAKELLEEVERAIKIMSNDAPDTPVQRGAIESVRVMSRDESSQATKHTRVFDSLTVELPMSAKGSSSYAAVMRKVDAFAEIVADARGSSGVEVFVTKSREVRRKVALETTTLISHKGNPITIQKYAIVFESPEVQRITVKAPPINASQ